MIANIPAEELSELIGAVYDCALNPVRWEPTLDSIVRKFGFASSVIGINGLPRGETRMSATIGVPPEWLARIPEFSDDVIDAWGGQERVQASPLGEPIIASVAGGEAFFRNRYLLEWANPQGIHDAVTIIIVRDMNMVGTITFGLYGLGDEANATQVAALRLLSPHFRRAITISDMLDMKAVEASTFASALDTLNAGTLLVDHDLGIVHANSAAERMLAEGTAVRAQRGRLTVGQRAAGQALEAAVRQASEDEAGLGQKGIGIPAAQAGDVSTVIHVLPMRGGEFRPGLAPRATAALFVTPSSVPPSMPSDALALLYDLTPAEVRMVELVCDGKDQAEMSAMLGIAKSTVKTHLLNVFAKTGCSRQVDLVKLVTSLTMPA